MFSSVSSFCRLNLKFDLELFIKNGVHQCREGTARRSPSAIPHPSVLLLSGTQSLNLILKRINIAADSYKVNSIHTINSPGFGHEYNHRPMASQADRTVLISFVNRNSGTGETGAKWKQNLQTQGERKTLFLKDRVHMRTSKGRFPGSRRPFVAADSHKFLLRQVGRPFNGSAESHETGQSGVIRILQMPCLRLFQN